MFLNKSYYNNVLNNKKKSIKKISNWYIKNKIPKHFKILTPKIFLVHYRYFCIRRLEKNRKKCPEHVVSLLNLDRYSLRTLPSYNKRTIQDILNWLKEQQLSQYEYKSLMF